MSYYLYFLCLLEAVKREISFYYILRVINHLCKHKKSVKTSCLNISKMYINIISPGNTALILNYYQLMNKSNVYMVKA